MKKIAVLLVVIFAVLSLTSCSSHRSGGGGGEETVTAKVVGKSSSPSSSRAVCPYNPMFKTIICTGSVGTAQSYSLEVYLSNGETRNGNVPKEVWDSCSVRDNIAQDGDGSFSCSAP